MMVLGAFNSENMVGIVMITPKCLVSGFSVFSELEDIKQTKKVRREA